VILIVRGGGFVGQFARNRDDEIMIAWDGNYKIMIIEYTKK
jgi:hypothetical protein